MESIILGITISVIVISFFVCFYYVYKYKQLQKYVQTLIEKIKSKYIKPDVRLYNAVLKAKEMAQQNNNKYEAKIFQVLIQEIKEKWH